MTDPHAALIARIPWALATIAELVQRGRAEGWIPGEPLSEVPAALPGDLGTRSPMTVLATRLELSAQELDLLWLLACVELDPHVASAAQLVVAPGMVELSAQLVEQLVTRGQASARDPFDRLERLALVHGDARLPRHRRPVRLDARVLELARGRLELDAGLRAIAVLEHPRPGESAATDLPDDLRAALAVADPRPMIIVTGLEGAGRTSLVRAASAYHGHATLAVDARGLATDPERLVLQLRAIARECRLHDAWPVLREVDGLADRLAIIEHELLAELDAPVFATARDGCTWSIARPTLAIAVGLPTAATRASLWRRSLPSARPEVVEACAERYAISPGLIGRCARAASSLVADAAHLEATHVHHALRAQLEQRLRGLARRIEPTQTWNDLVLPVDQLDLLIELVARVRHRRRVLDDWGFADKVGRGVGVSALLSGPPGTGKTMIAGLVARELGLDLYQVDLSRVVSKYIGETEQQLARLFEAAESGHAILLFDEADALFAKRTEVKTSNDRYANLEVDYLLQRIEAFAGIALLTTNHETAIDPAFLRRLAFHVRVPLPDERERELIWRAMLPDRAERAADLDLAGLARAFELSGGYIKNAVLRAAFASAEACTPITNAQLWRAARAECEAIGKLATAGRARGPSAAAR